MTRLGLRLEDDDEDDDAGAESRPRILASFTIILSLMSIGCEDFLEDRKDEVSDLSNSALGSSYIRDNKILLRAFNKFVGE